MTRIPTATRRQHVEVRASQTGPKLPRLHALARHALPRFTAGTAKWCRAWLSPNRPARIPFHRQAEGFPPGPERPGFHPRRNPINTAGVNAEIGQKPSSRLDERPWTTQVLLVDGLRRHQASRIRWMRSRSRRPLSSSSAVASREKTLIRWNRSGTRCADPRAPDET
jgi:hypothetical protein